MNAGSPSTVAARVAALERARGVEVVTVVVARADHYPEIPWRAGALAASIAALVVAVGDVLRPDWATSATLLLALAAVMLSGAGAALATMFVRPFARLFLSRLRAEAETRQYAHAYFLDRQLFRTRRRNGILVLVARFEHRVELVADIGFDGRVAADEWGSVIAPMVPLLREGRAEDALAAGLDALEALLASKGYAGGSGANELPDATVEIGEEPQ